MPQPTAPTNVAAPKGVKTHSTFQPNYSMYQTMRFGEITPNLAIEAVDGDHLVLNVESDVDTYTLKAPLMTSVRKKQSFAAVPLRAILPRTAELLITNPVVGDDVIAEDVNCGIRYTDLLEILNGYIDAFADDLVTAYDAEEHQLGLYTDAFFRWMPLLSLFFSNGSLLAHLGINISPLFLVKDGLTYEEMSFDQFFDFFWDWLHQIYLATFPTTPSEYADAVATFKVYSASGEFENVILDVHNLGFGVTPRRLLELARDGYFIQVADQETFSEASFQLDVEFYFRVSSELFDEFDDFINLSRLAAYQICCAQFFSNDHVDDIYSAELYRMNMQSLAGNLGLANFVYNGISYQYDALSSYVITNVLSSIFGDVISDDLLGLWFYAMNLFSLQRSLRFGDYFAGSKVQPLAVGDVNVSVDSDSMTVDIVDVTRNIQRQRFLNQVNRVGRRFKEYLQGVFGDSPAQDYHEAIWLNEYHDVIGAEETSNTGDKQFDVKFPNSKTSNLRMNNSRFAFDMNIKEPSVILGFVQFDVPRAYVFGIDRLALHADRYDMFNPFMQFVGDQSVSGIEIIPSQRTPFGYQLRYQEYKERVDRAAGGFAEYLPGYSVLFDPTSGSITPNSTTGLQETHISSDFIRSRASEFDSLYTSLVHWNPAGYFHFIVRSDIKCDFKRPMAFAPSIL